MVKDEKNTANKDVFVHDDIIVNKHLFEEQLKEKEKIIETKNRAIKKKNEEIKEKDKEIKNLQTTLRLYEEQRRLDKAKRYGKSTEQLKAIQFDLFETQEEDDEGEDSVAEETQTVSYKRKKTKTTGRQIDTTHLPREIVIHDLKDDEKCCADCQGELHKISEDVSEKLEIIPATLKVVEHRRMNYACRQCDTAKSAPKPATLVPKSMAGNSLIVEVLLAKYQRHIPFYRQSQIFASAKLAIPANTIGNWCMAAFEAIAPIGETLWAQLDETHVLQVDETPVNMLSEDKKGYMWVYHSCDPGRRFVLYDYHSSRGAEVVNKRLTHFSGILQTDGYAGYKGQRDREGVVTVGCFAHCRRKFADVVKASPRGKTGKAHMAVATIGKLYQIEREAAELSYDDRYALRQERAKPILDKFYGWLQETQPKVAPQSQLGKAVNYALNQWSELYEYIHHGEVEIDNNEVENKIRPFALGRKNWLFVGNQRGADAAALFYSLIETAKLNGIEPRVYLMKLFELAPGVRRGDISAESLLPHHLKYAL